MASSEARELSLIDKLELKVALAESNSALQKILSTYLPPLLLKLASDHLKVRNKVSQALLFSPDVYRAFRLLEGCRSFKPCPFYTLRYLDLIFRT